MEAHMFEPLMKTLLPRHIFQPPAMRAISRDARHS